ncbi:hypothetical protein OSTOST_01962 [Ostertagia ostertagi]
MLYHDINGPLQGQWLICALIGLLSLLIFIGKILELRLLDAMETFPSTVHEHYSREGNAADPLLNYNPEYTNSLVRSTLSTVSMEQVKSTYGGEQQQKDWDPFAKSSAEPVGSKENRRPKIQEKKVLQGFADELLQSVQESEIQSERTQRSQEKK